MHIVEELYQTPTSLNLSFISEMSTVSTSSAMIDEAAIDFLSDADYEKDVFRTKVGVVTSVSFSTCHP